MTVIDYLEASAERVPEKLAIVDEQHGLTYGQVLSAARKIATGIGQRIGCQNQPVAVIIDRNAESICAFLGIAMSRNFYVPIDAKLPVNRIRGILSQMQPAALISFDEPDEEILADIRIPVFLYRELCLTPVDDQMIQEMRTTALDTDPLYAICTSGSTGVPKGVLVGNRSVIDFINVFTKTFELSSDDVFGNQAPFDFDVSVKDIYSTLALGATMYIIPQVCFSMPKKLVEVLDEKRISVIIWAVSAMCIVSTFRAFKHRVPGSLKKVLFSGEVMPVKMLNIWREALPDVTYVNLYGPTEITCNCLYYIIDRDFEETEKLPLGIPFQNESVMYLNEENREIGPGETGEICVRGTCLAMGYYRDPERTAAAFVQNPMNSRYPELIYRTGDLAELREDGQYYFAARKDFQIKHMGHRIELEEIERYVHLTDGVLRACCLFDERKNRILAFYVGDAEKADIILQMKQHLPKYMIPNVFIRIEQMPLNKNGKTDRKKLMEWYDASK